MGDSERGLRSVFDLTRGPVLRQIVLFSLPILAGGIVTQFYQIANAAIVGRFIGASAFAAVSATTPIATIINMFANGLAVGSGVIIAQRTGAGNVEALQRAINTIAFLTLALGVFITVVCLIGVGPLLKVMGTPEDIFDDSLLYMAVIILGVTGNLSYQIGSGALRGMGDPVWPFFFLCFCALLNVGLALIAVFGGFGICGVALATVIAQSVSAVGIVRRINGGGYAVKLRRKEIKFDKEEARNVVSIGLPAGMHHIGNSIAGIVIQSYVNGFGLIVIAANNVVSRFWDLLFMLPESLSTAVGTFVAQNIAVSNMDRVKQGINKSMFWLVIFGGVLCICLIAIREILPYIFVDDASVAAIASQGIVILAFEYTFKGIDRVLVNAMRGAGNSMVPMIAAQIGTLSRIPLVFFLAVRTGDYMGIFYAMLIASFLRTATITAYYFCGGWKATVRRYEERHGEKANNFKIIR